jgi:putative Mn2+ efflux pump MntP
MGFPTILFIAIGLAMDAFAVSIAASICLATVSSRQIFRLSFHTGFFQFLMPVIGWYLGASFSSYIADYDHWIAFTLLALIGAKMIRESFEDKHCETESVCDADSNADSDNTRNNACAALKKSVKDPTSGFSLLFIAIATSIDALAVGVSLAMLKVDIWYPAAVIGVVTMLMSIAGMKIGERLGTKFGSRMELTGGIILIAMGVKIVIEHTC